MLAVLGLAVQTRGRASKRRERGEEQRTSSHFASINAIIAKLQRTKVSVLGRLWVRDGLDGWAGNDSIEGEAKGDGVEASLGCALPKVRLVDRLRIGQRGRGGAGFVLGGGRKLTEGTLGLEGAQFLDSPMEVGIVAAGVTVKLTELGFILFEQQRVDAVLLHQAGFEDTAAPEIPVGVEDRVVERAFEFAFGREFRGERLTHGCEGLTVRIDDDQVTGRESVFAGILRGARFAGFGAGAGRELRVGAVGCYLS